MQLASVAVPGLHSRESSVHFDTWRTESLDGNLRALTGGFNATTADAGISELPDANAAMSGEIRTLKTAKHMAMKIASRIAAAWVGDPTWFEPASRLDSFAATNVSLLAACAPISMKPGVRSQSIEQAWQENFPKEANLFLVFQMG